MLDTMTIPPAIDDVIRMQTDGKAFNLRLTSLALAVTAVVATSAHNVTLNTILTLPTAVIAFVFIAAAAASKKTLYIIQVTSFGVLALLLISFLLVMADWELVIVIWHLISVILLCACILLLRDLRRTREAMTDRYTDQWWREQSQKVRDAEENVDLIDEKSQSGAEWSDGDRHPFDKPPEVRWKEHAHIMTFNDTGTDTDSEIASDPTVAIRVVNE